ncbi:MAG: serine/threonine protein kinase [Burkholderiaceae bacterium]
MHSLHPYAELTPDVVLDALQSIGLRGDGRLTALSSYENRVYLVHLEEPHEGHASVVAKFYRPGRWSDAQVLEEHTFAHELMAAEVPVIGPFVVGASTLHHHAGFAFSVSPRRGGRAPELDDFEVLEWTGRFIARIHSVGAARPFAQRGRIDVDSHAREPMQWLLQHDAVAPDVRSAWQQRVEQAVVLIEQHAVLRGTRSGGGSDADGTDPEGTRVLRLHGDCHPGNILWTPAGQAGEGPHFVDLDDARMGPAVQDLWMLLSGERAQRTQLLGALIDGYEQMREFDRRELALIEPLRTLRLIHYSAWLARRWDDPAFPAAFPWFGGRDYWQGQVQMLDEQIEAMQEPPLVA